MNYYRRFQEFVLFSLSFGDETDWGLGQQIVLGINSELFGIVELIVTLKTFRRKIKLESTR